MHDPAQRRLSNPDQAEDGGERCPIGDIAAIHLDAGPLSLQLGHSLAAPRRVRAATAEERDRASAAGDEPARGGKAEAVDPAGDQIGAVAAGHELRRLAQAYPLVRARHQHQLADVTRRLHQPKGVVDFGVGERPVRQRPDLAPVQLRRDLGQEIAGQIWPPQRQLIDVDREIRDILPQRAQMEAAVEVEIALAQLEEAAERPEQLDAALHRLAAQRV